ncbi:MAG: glycosyltransferase family 2 protein [Pyrinomonadaceae bacterium]
MKFMFDSQNLINALLFVAWATWALWLVGAFLTWRGMRDADELAPLASDELKTSDAPFVSIIVPARNEAHRSLEQSFHSMLVQDYGAFEVVAVNDCSTDATGEILRAIEKTDARVRVIDGTETPGGWLGKPHALNQALDAARGDWVLATDADMIFARSAVRTAMQHVLENHYEALTLLPHVDCLSFWERVFLPVFGWFMLVAAPLERANDPRCKESLGIGGFFLLRRDVLESVGGYAAVRADVTEDLRLAELLKRQGAAIHVKFAQQLIGTRMQTNLREIWEGFSKNLYAGTRFSLARTIAGSVGVMLFAVAPIFVAVICAALSLSGMISQAKQFILPCLLIWFTQILTFAVINRRWQVPARYAFAVPTGHALFVAILLNSAVRIITGGGVTWKGRKIYDRASNVRPPMMK